MRTGSVIRRLAFNSINVRRGLRSTGTHPSVGAMFLKKKTFFFSKDEQV